MIGLLLPILARWGVAERFRRPLATVALVVLGGVLLAGAWAAWLHFHDEGVIERHETRRQLEDTTTALEGERRANSAGGARDDARSAASDQSDSAMEEAEDADPQAAKAPAGPVSRAAAERFQVPR